MSSNFPELTVYQWVRIFWLDGSEMNEPVVTVGLLVDEDDLYYYLVNEVALDAITYDPDKVDIIPKYIVNSITYLKAV